VPLGACRCVHEDASGASGSGEVGAQSLGHARPAERVEVAAIGEQAVTADSDETEAVQEPVGGFDGTRVGGELCCGDVTDDRDVRRARSDRGIAGEHGQGPAVPRGAQHRRERVDVAPGRL
jgi:hypothetical protein